MSDDEPTRPIALPPACSLCGCRGAHAPDCESHELDARAEAHRRARLYWLSIRHDGMRILGALAIGARSRGARLLWRDGEVA